MLLVLSLKGRVVHIYHLPDEIIYKVFEKIIEEKRRKWKKGKKKEFIKRR